MATRYRVVLVTVPDKKTGLKITQGLVDNKLAACVNFIPGLESYYRWKGKTHKAHEILLIIKTQKDLVGSVASFVRENHPYEIPEVISLSIMEGNQAYLDWIGANTNLSQPIKDLTPAELERELE